MQTSGFAFASHFTGRPLRDFRATVSTGEPRTLAVRFPDDVPTHSRDQRFTYDERLRLVRHDYTAEPFGSRARAVHRCRAHASAGGLLFATSRRVYPRGPGGRPLPFPTLVWIELDQIEVTPR